MTPKLTDEMRQAIAARNGEPVPVEDDQTHTVYVIVDSQTHQRAMQALQRQEDTAAIEEGVADLEAGRGMPAREADIRIREKLGFPPVS
jgi:hypothetical protein